MDHFWTKFASAFPARPLSCCLLFVRNYRTGKCTGSEAIVTLSVVHVDESREDRHATGKRPESWHDVRDKHVFILRPDNAVVNKSHVYCIKSLTQLASY
jgi:hypothetical protein